MKYKTLFLFTLIFNLNNIFAWNFNGHQLIAEFAYQELKDSDKNKLDKLLYNFISNLSSNEKKIIKKQKYNISTLAKTSILPDIWKKYNFYDLINKLGIDSKLLIKNINDQKTYTWHYQNKIINANGAKLIEDTSKLNNIGDLHKVLNQLVNNTRNIKDSKAKALAIVFISHLVADAHQPLHTISMQSKSDPKLTDRGGNGFCIKKSKLNSCKINLHKFWDNGAGILKNKNYFEHKMSDVISDYSIKINNHNLTKVNLSNWLDESSSEWQFIYNTNEYHYPTDQYTKKAQTICAKQIVLASYRLSNLLKQLLAV